MHLTVPIKFKEEDFSRQIIKQDEGVITIYDSENKPIISTDGYVNKQLLEEMIKSFNKVERIKINVKE